MIKNLIILALIIMGLIFLYKKFGERYVQKQEKATDTDLFGLDTPKGVDELLK